METSDSQNTLSNFSEQLAAAIERAAPSIVALDARPRVATSGVVWRENIVVSTNHTVRRDEDIRVLAHDGRSFAATLIGRDAGTDLAVLKITDEAAAQSLKPAEIGDAATLKTGNLILAVGRTSEESGVTASVGIVSQISGEWQTWRGDRVDRLIRLDAAIRLGFSGGALVDAGGKVLGVNTSAFGRGAALTIPAETVNRVVETLLTRGRIARPFLGVGMQTIPLPQNLREKLNLEQTGGLMILTTEPDGPAERAGIVIGDILLQLENAATTEIGDVQTILAGREPGQTLKATLLRGGEKIELEVVLGEQPARGYRRRRC